MAQHSLAPFSILNVKNISVGGTGQVLSSVNSRLLHSRLLNTDPQQRSAVNDLGFQSWPLQPELRSVWEVRAWCLESGLKAEVQRRYHTKKEGLRRPSATSASLRCKSNEVRRCRILVACSAGCTDSHVE